jgi:hypothetical protein
MVNNILSCYWQPDLDRGFRRCMLPPPPPPPHPHVIWGKGVLRAEWVILTKLSMKLERERQREYTVEKLSLLYLNSGNHQEGGGVWSYDLWF